MPKPRKYSDLYGSQKAYRQTDKGKAALKRYESSEKVKQRKRDWWQKNKGAMPPNRRQYFIDTYGEVDLVLDRVSPSKD